MRLILVLVICLIAALGGGLLGAAAGLFGILFGTAFALGLAVSGIMAFGMLSNTPPDDIDIDVEDNAEEIEPMDYN